MNINKLVNLPRGSRLVDALSVPTSDQFLSSSLYRVASQTYLCLTPFRPGGLEKDPSGPFISGIAWAVNDGAARRAFLSKVEADDGASDTVASEFLPTPIGTPGYGEIMKALKSKKPRVCQETASYRIASDGQFIHRMLETENIAFFFRNRSDDDGELPYAALIKLK